MNQSKHVILKKAVAMSAVAMMTLPMISNVANAEEVATKTEDKVQEKQVQVIHPNQKQEGHKEVSEKQVATPYLSGGTGFSNKFEALRNEDGILNIKTASSALISIGVGVQTKTTFKIDPEIAKPFFSTPNWKDYVSGTVDRLGTWGIGNSKIQMQELLTKKTGWGKGDDKAFYDEAKQELIILTPKYVAAATQYQNVDMKIDLGKWSKDTGRLVENKLSYKFNMVSKPNDLAANWSWGDANSVLMGVPDNSWVENHVDPTTLETSDNHTFKGNATQNMANRHPADFSISLTVNGNDYKKDVQINEDGSWEYDFGSYLKDGDVVGATVIATEKEAHENEIMDINKSKEVKYTVGEDSTPWEDWNIVEPTISDAYDGETMITGVIPEQNYQNNRTYSLVVKVNDKEVYTQDDIEKGVYNAPIFGANLVKNDKVEAYIIGHEANKEDKTSQIASIIVKDNKDEQADWDKWEVKPAILNDVVSGDRFITGLVPAQNKFNGRNYEVQVTVNGEQVGTKAFSFDGGEYTIALDKDLSYKDEVKAIVIGHEANEKDKSSEETTKIVADKTGWEDWKVENPTISKLTEGDKKVTGQVPVQDEEFGRTYTMDLYINGEKVDTKEVQSKSDYAFELTKPLEKTDTVAVEITGHQKNYESKMSERITANVEAIVTALTGNDYNFDAHDEYITGTHSRDIKKVKIFVNGHDYQTATTNNDGEGKYKIYARQYITKFTDKIVIKGLNADGQVVKETPVNIVKTPTSLEASPFVLKQDELISGTVSDDVKKLKLEVNGEIVNQVAPKDGKFEIYTNGYVKEMTDKVKVIAYNDEDVLLKEVTITLDDASKNSALTYNPYKLGDDLLTGTVSEDIDKIKLIVDGETLNNVYTKNGEFSMYALGFVNANSKKVELVGYSKAGFELKRITVEVQ
ncbi:immunoglobulin-like domain-containing protein [Listeria rocourtiae]|uniref:immunoglobulin-like domain-containing protein n=1 Tax=Listeria rocourtiae TaxID=647910 RepID=UPI003D2F8BA3